MKRLSDLRKGEEAVISSIEDGALSLKLMEMGCMPGERVKVEAVAPFGDPIAICVADYTLSMRKSDAEKIILD